MFANFQTCNHNESTILTREGHFKSNENDVTFPFAKSKMSDKVVPHACMSIAGHRRGCGPDAIWCSPTAWGICPEFSLCTGFWGGKDLFLVHCRGGNLEQGMQKTRSTLFLMWHSMFPILPSFRLSALEFNYKWWEFWALWMVKPFKDSGKCPPPSPASHDLETFRILVILMQNVESICRVLYFQNNLQIACPICTYLSKVCN